MAGNVISGSIASLIGGVSQQPWNVRLPSQGEEQINCHSTVTEFMKRRPATSHIAHVTVPNDSDNFVVVPIDKNAEEQFLAFFSQDGISIYDLEGNSYVVDISESGKQYLGQAVDATRDLKFCTIKDYTFVVNRQVIVSEGVAQASSGDSEEGEDEGESTPTPVEPEREPEAIFFVRQAAFSTTYRIKLDGRTFSYTTPSAVYEQGTTPPSISAAGIASALASQISSAGGYSVSRSNSTIWVHRSTYFTFSMSNSRSESFTYCFGKTSRKITSMPIYGPNGYKCRITGDTDTAVDDVWVKFATENDVAMGKGSWVETVSPDSNNQIDPATMPHALIRKKLDTFSFEPIEWKQRQAGDEVTNPMPSFVGSRISNILFYKSRLAFLSGDNLIMSEAQEFFNYFKTTVETTTDADPIDIAAAGVKDTSLYSSVLFNGNLLLFSRKAQFILEHEAVLSNATASVNPVTEFESSEIAEPVSSGKTIFFAIDRGRYVGVREYISYDTNNTNANAATEVTSHCPHYVEGPVRDLICSTNNDLLVVRSSGDLHILWVYKYYWNGNEKAQSSWYKWHFDGELFGCAFFGTKLYLVLRHDKDYCLEVMDIEPNHKDDGEDFEFCLDRKVTEEMCTIGSYDPLTKTTTVTVNYADPKIRLVTRSGGDLEAGKYIEIESITVNSASTTLVCKEKLSGDWTKFFVGVPYESSYTFTTLGARNEQAIAITTGRLQLHYLKMNFDRTGFVEVTVSTRGKQDYEYKFSGKRLGEGSAIIGDIPIYSGQINVPVMSKNDNTSIVVHSDSPLPFALVNADWEGFYTVRSQRM